ncbi:MAG: hypothetical protein GX801_05125 [Fibrobacter sp.]|nr:hypothetical protein [Fibrobacter sp.]
MEKIWVLLSVVVLVFMSCGDKKGAGPDVEEPKSSSSVKKEPKSSSSSKVEEVPVLNAATTDDLFEILALDSENGRSVTLVLGKESGIYTKLYFDEDNTSPAAQLLGLYSLDSKGKMTFDFKDCLTTEALRKEICPDEHSEPVLWFKVDKDGDLQMGSSEDELKNAEIAELVLPPAATAMRKASDLVGSWDSDSVSWEFYSDYSFVKTSKISETKTLIQAGRYDIQRSQLVVINTQSEGSGLSYYELEVFSALKDGMKLKLNGISTPVSLEFNPGEALGEVLDASTLVGTWESADKEKVYSLTINESGDFVIKIYKIGNTVPSFNDTGIWSSAGNRLVLDFKDGQACTGDGKVGGIIIDGNVTCYATAIGVAEKKGENLTFSTEYWPSKWTQP